MAKKRRGFIYNGITAYATSKGVYREFTGKTLDRNIRKLAEQGFLDHIEKKTRRNNRTTTIVIFVPTERFYNVVSEGED